MKFIDLQSQQAKIQEKIQDNFSRVMDHGQYVNGPEVGQLEEKLALYCGVKHAVACSSGTDALLMALMSCGVGPGDAIFTTPFAENAVVSIIKVLGATPVFVDIDPFTFNIDPEQLVKAVEAVVKGDSSLYPLPGDGSAAHLVPKGILSVDLFGLPADYDAVCAIAGKHGLFVIEVGTEAFGGVYKGRRTCSLADIGCAAFPPEAPFGAYGNGGMCFTDDDRCAGLIRSIGMHGREKGGDDHVRAGIDGRMNSLQAAMLLAKFEIFPEEIALRQDIAGRYTQFLDENPLLVTPYVPDGVTSAWFRYSLLTESEEDRLKMLKKLKEAEIPAEIHYAGPLYLQPAFADLQYRDGDFPVSNDYATRIFSVPMHPYLTSKEQEEIAYVLNDWE